MKSLFLAAASLAALSCGAHAATIQQSSTLPSDSPSYYTAPTLVETSGTVYNGEVQSLDSIYRSPFDGTPAAGAAFSSVEGDGSAYYNVSGNQLSLIWGSPDTYNQLEFWSGLGGSGTKLGTVSGSSIIPADGLGFSNVTITGVGNFNSIVLLNDPSQNAFEVSNFAVSSVPLPASLPMFGGAVLVLGVLGYRHRRKSVVRA